MTLSTNVAVRLPAENTPSPRKVLDKLLEALIEAGGSWEPSIGGFMSEEHEPATKRLPLVTEPRGGEDSEELRMGSRLGQGFHAITDISYRRDGAPLYAKDVSDYDLEPSWYEDEEPDAIERAKARLGYPACTYLMDMDTAYGYHPTPSEGAAPGVTGCTSLHAYAIIKLNQWVVAQGGSLIWQNEYEGTWHTMDDEEGWKKWAGSDREAMDWFHNVAQPGIATMVAKSGGRLVP